MQTYSTSHILEFNKGTLLLKVQSSNSSSLFEQFVWDERVGAQRAKASKYDEIVKVFASNQSHRLDDRVYKSLGSLSNWEAISLRTYQKAALLNWEASGKKGIVCLPTGAGKTRVAIATIAYSNVSTLCLVPTRVLLHQWIKNVHEFYKGPIGILGDGCKKLHPITVSTFESAFRNMPWIGNCFKLLIIDEVHHFGNAIRDEIFSMSIAPYRLGLTATRPDSDKNSLQLQNLQEFVGPIIFSMNIHDLTGVYLSDFSHIKVSLRLNQVEAVRYERESKLFKSYYRSFKKQYPDSNWQEFTKLSSLSASGRQALAAYFRSRRIVNLPEAKIVKLESLLQQHQNCKKLIFTSDSESAITISRLYLIPAITSEIKKAERESILQDFLQDKIKAIVSCKVLNEGIDIPDAEVAIIVGGNSNEREHVQRIGRLLRPSEGKKAIVYELIMLNTHEERQSIKRGKPFENFKFNRIKNNI
ncbi:MAG: DEAD/DEAH box helicase family protein [Bdellovibrionota bacterium]